MFVLRFGVPAALCLLLAAPAAGQEIKREAVKRIDSIQGAQSFEQYCAVCHGSDAKGTGPAAKVLKTAPSDLTLLARRSGGKFSAADVEAKVVGTRDVFAHGTREMPIWGPAFRGMETDDAAKLRVVNLVNYLRSIQQ